VAALESNAAMLPCDSSNGAAFNFSSESFVLLGGSGRRDDRADL